MGIQPDHWIQSMAEQYQMIEPFVDRQVKGGVSYGLSSYGYDFRIDREFQVLKTSDGYADPKAHNPDDYETINTDVCIIPAGGYVMGRTIEYFRIPRGILTLCNGKSTYARCGVTVYVTPFEPEWEGHATIAIVNSSGRPAKIYAGEGIAQLMFFAGTEECRVSYADKKGQYQAAKSITHAKVASV